MSAIRCNRSRVVTPLLLSLAIEFAAGNAPALAAENAPAPGTHNPPASGTEHIQVPIAGGLLSGNPSSSNPLQAIMTAGRQIMPRIVRVQARESNGRINIGSGVPVGVDLVATNCHVTRRAHSIDLMVITPFGPIPVPVVKQAGSAEHDVCLLRTGIALPMPPVGIGETPKRGDAVVAIGFTGGMSIRMHAGEVTLLHPFEGSSVIQSNTAFDSGASGGGLFTADGRLVGLITFRSLIGQPRYFSAPAQWIRTVETTQAFKPIAPNPEGKAFWEQSRAALPEFLQADSAAQAPTALIAPNNAD